MVAPFWITPPKFVEPAWLTVKVVVPPPGYCR